MLTLRTGDHPPPEASAGGGRVSGRAHGGPGGSHPSYSLNGPLELMSPRPSIGPAWQPDLAGSTDRTHGFQLAQHVSHTVALDKYHNLFRASLERRLPNVPLRYAKAQSPTLVSVPGCAGALGS